MAKPRTKHYSVKGTKLYPVKNAKERFNEIIKFKREHKRQTLKKRSKAL